jgi:hypothetical protein
MPLIVNIHCCLSQLPVCIFSLPHAHSACAGHVASLPFQSTAMLAVLEVKFTLGARFMIYTLQRICNEKNEFHNFVKFALTICNASIAIPSLRCEI